MSVFHSQSTKMYHFVVLLLVATPWMLTSAAEFRVFRNRQIGRRDASLAGNQDFDAMTYLERTGYLDDLNTVKSQHHLPDSVKQALREFQQFVGLPVTGRLDAQTVNMMKRPRCGNPDVIKPSQRHTANQSDDDAPENYHLMAAEWEKDDLTYKWLKYTDDMSRDDQRRVVAEAFQKWSRVSPLNFREVQGSEQADIDLGFYTGQHTQWCSDFTNSLALAHAFGPGHDKDDGAVHFNDEYTWAVHGSDKMDAPHGLDQTSTHEIGHALGLDHSDVQTSVMFPYYYKDNTELTDDDIRGIQRKYGPPQGRPVSTEKDCAMTFDDIVKGAGGSVYVFRGEYFYILSTEGLTKKRKISEYFIGAPDYPDAVLYDRLADWLLMFKGQYYYRFDGYEMYSGYPKLLAPDFQNIDGALMRFDRDYYLFKGNKITRWEEGFERYPRGFPQDIKSFYNDRNAPDRVDAAFEVNNSITFLFNGDKYWKYIVDKQKEQASPGYPKSIKPFWLHCGFVPGRDEEPIFGYVG